MSAGWQSRYTAQCGTYNMMQSVLISEVNMGT
jgi:hypothetical protein